MSDVAEIRRALATARRAEREWRRVIREEGGSLNALQLSVCEARLTRLTRERIAAEYEFEDVLARVEVAQ